MNAQEFAFWLQGYLEMSDAKTLGEKEVKILKDHLALVFEKKTPQYWTYQTGPNQIGGQGQSGLIVEADNPPAFICNTQTFATC